MIRATMAVAAVATGINERAAAARAARGARARAIIIDTFLYAFISLVVNNVYGVAHIETFPQITIGGGGYTTAIAVPIQMLLGTLYFLIPEAMFGATPGKWWTHLKVVRLDGRPLGWREVATRNVLRIVDYQPFFYVFGGLFVLLTDGSQRIGDRVAGTSVVNESFAREPGATRTSDRLARRILGWSLVAAFLFTIVFDYFGRPPLVIAGDFNQHQFVMTNIDSYSLGNPTWGLGTVAYPVTARSVRKTCTGWIQLRWEFLGWSEDSGTMDCTAS